ncbi:MAG: hypothetical protein LBJ00_12375 [Planctomycetaceae bacterium]|nr:hypothetical protein [Planctomycetaceae bacterium]
MQENTATNTDFGKIRYTVADKAIGFALEQPLLVVAFTCSVTGILKQIEHIGCVVGVVCHNGALLGNFLYQKIFSKRILPNYTTTQ